MPLPCTPLAEFDLSEEKAFNLAEYAEAGRLRHRHPSDLKSGKARCERARPLPPPPRLQLRRRRAHAHAALDTHLSVAAGAVSKRALRMHRRRVFSAALPVETSRDPACSQCYPR